MPRKSGVFKCIELCLKDGSITNITSWDAKLLESSELHRYYMLRNPQPRTEPNPFSKLNYQLDNRGNYAAHLSFFEEFYSHNSVFPNRRNLSYCHGTEYFSIYEPGGAHKRITVHYHFNISGKYLHTLAKDEAGVQIEVTSLQESIFRDRAIQYQTEFEKILAKKHLKLLELAKAVESGNDLIMNAVMQGNIAKPQLIAEIRRQAELNRVKDSIGDMKKDSSASFRMFEQIVIQTCEQAAVKDKFVAPMAQELSSEHTSLDVIEKQGITVSKAKKEQASKTKHSYSAEIAVFETELHSLGLKSKLIRAKVSEQQVSEYLNDYIALRTRLLILSMDLQYKNEIKKLQSLLEQMALLKTPEAIFEQAIQELNLEHVQASFEFCSHSASYRIFSDLIDEWSQAAKNKESAKEDKIQAMAEFFSENSDSFGGFIKDRSQFISMPEHSDFGVSMLGTAFACKSKKMFVAFLDFGVNLYVPWVLYKNGKTFDALSIMMQSKSEEDFYIEELMAHGLQFSRRADAKTVQALKSSVQQPIIRRRRDKSIDKLMDAGAKMGKQAITTLENYENHDETDGTTISCAFINFSHSIERHKANLVTYSSFAKYCPLSSLLFSAAILIKDGSVNIYSVASSKIPGLDLVAEDEEKLSMIMGIGHQSCPKNLCNLLDMGNAAVEPTVVQCLSIICNAVKARFPVPLAGNDFETSLAELYNYARNMNQLKSYDMASACFVAIIFLFGLKGELSCADYLRCVSIWRDAGLRQLEHVQQYKEALLRSLQKPQVMEPDLIKSFGQVMSSIFKQANAYFVYAIQIAYFSPYTLLTSDPIVLDCYDRSLDIINNAKLSVEVKQELQAKHRSLQQMQQVRDGLLHRNDDQEEAVPSKVTSDMTLKF